MPQKIRDLAVKTGSYTDDQGQEKGRWQNIGALMKGDDGNEFIILHRWFNPAGIPNPDNRDSVLVSCFRPQQQGQGQQQTPAPQQPAPGQYGAQQPAAPHPPGGDDFSEEIPFVALHNACGG